MPDTIVALSSGLPPAAIAVIRTSGPSSHQAARQIAGALPAPRTASVRSLRHPATGEMLDHALILRFAAPHSATGEDCVEYQCHGGRAVVSAVIDALTSLPGMRVAEPGEFTRRALANGRIDLTEAEGLADLLEAETQSQRRAALAVAGGSLSRQIEAWQMRLLDLSARAEAAIDYVGDEDETATDSGALRLDAQALADDLRAWLARPRAELLKHGVRVAIAGPPNAGKSSLINALVGHDRAIVTPIPGTTRDTIEVPLAVEGVPLTLIDTAGLRETQESVEAMGIARARAETSRADIMLWLGRPCDAPPHPHCILIAAKCDLREFQGHPADTTSVEALRVSSVTRENLSTLLGLIATRARSLLPTEGEAALNARQATAVKAIVSDLRDLPTDLLLLSERLRAARNSIDRLTGRAGVDEALDALFERFCLGK